LTSNEPEKVPAARAPGCFLFVLVVQRLRNIHGSLPRLTMPIIILEGVDDGERHPLEECNLQALCVIRGFVYSKCYLLLMVYLFLVLIFKFTYLIRLTIHKEITLKRDS
jgi:hypothetical protein